MAMKEITATEAAKWFWSFVNSALQWPIAIKKNNKTVLVTLTPDCLRDLIDLAIADRNLAEWIAKEKDVRNMFSRIEDKNKKLKSIKRMLEVERSIKTGKYKSQKIDDFIDSI